MADPRLRSGTELVAAGGQRAFPSFDVAGGNLDILHALCAELRRRRAGAFLASTPASIAAYHGMNHFVEAVADAAARYDVAVAAHLDHATDLGSIRDALAAGCRSVMVDGSALPLTQNVELTAAAVALAGDVGASVEGEIGIIAGKEDSVDAERASLPGAAQAVEFAGRTGIDFLAPAIGTVHGTVATPRIDWDLAGELGRRSPVPLVLHGATGLGAEELDRLVELGFRKVNVATGIRAAFVSGLRRGLAGGEAIRPQAALAAGRRSVGDQAAALLELIL